ncbi:hypothetical protein C2W63_00118 [Bacillus velezensis]|nr:hypothetical protein C2W63_00118 [Bacillus velezensis]RUR97536.1 hypothetical protein EFW57_03042 [Bacillus velezensis]
MSKIYYTKTFGHQLLLMSLGSLKNPGIRAQPGFFTHSFIFQPDTTGSGTISSLIVSVSGESLFGFQHRFRP